MKKAGLIALILFPILLVFGGWGFTLYAGLQYFDTWAKRGQFGDLFGSVNALFSGLAFAGLIIAVFLQRQELALQREELKLQREEMGLAREQLTAQAAAQMALFRATVAQIKASAVQVRVESNRLRAEGTGDPTGMRASYAVEVDELAEEISAIVAEVESAAPDHQQPASTE